jgi:branched-subunit amino acid transport protein
MTSVWLAVLLVSLVCVVLRAAGPVAVRRSLPPKVDRWLQLMAPALLAAFVAVQTLGKDHHLIPDARLTGVTAAAAAILAGRSPLVVLVVAAAATAAVRALW